MVVVRGHSGLSATAKKLIDVTDENDVGYSTADVVDYVRGPNVIGEIKDDVVVTVLIVLKFFFVPRFTFLSEFDLDRRGHLLHAVTTDKYQLRIRAVLIPVILKISFRAPQCPG